MVETIRNTPEQGQFVRLRNRFWLVQDIVEDTAHNEHPSSYRVLLECLDDDNMGQTLSVIWEHEINAEVYTRQGLPNPRGWDNPAVFDAFISAIRWSSASMLVREGVQAPFYAAVRIHDYQLEPIVRTLTIPRVNLLIADDVGLGKTIEAGLIVQELLARRRIRRILIVCPASLQQQWQEEMTEKFRLDFHIIDRDNIQTLRREYGMHVNPWASFPRLITSMDFIKREQPLRLFQESLQRKDSALRDWDLLIVDEAHNVAPSGRANYAVDSDRTRMMRSLTDHFEHRLFLTATPHNGFTESFTALLELLDPLRFNRGPDVKREQVEQVMVRRLKDDVRTSLRRREFAERKVQSINLELSEPESELFSLLDRYTKSRLERLQWNESIAVRFALTMLKKRLLSSPRAFTHSISTHLNTLGAPDEMQPDEVLLERMTQRVGEDWADDVEKALAEDDAIAESTRFFNDLTPNEQQMLDEMSNLVGTVPDTKLKTVKSWIDDHLFSDDNWNRERLVIFTEYKDTLDYLTEELGKIYGEDRLLTLYGGMNAKDRQAIKSSFQTDPAETPVRILIATDAASEGLNLQSHCRYLMHYEIPWNPNRMEQRNGRIDRHGQKADEVVVYHFIYANREDSRFLQTVIDKVETMKADIGSVGDVIAGQVEEAMLGKRKDLTLPEQRQQMVQDVVRGELVTDDKIRQIRRQIDRTREKLSIKPDTMANVLSGALQVLDAKGLQTASDPELEHKAYRLRDLPRGWQNHEPLLKNKDGNWLDITFDNELSQDRRDITLLHLNHPLMRQALGTFRARLWSQDGDSGLHRVSYRVSSEYSTPAIIAYGRLVAVGEFGQRLHEEVVTVGAEFDGQNLYALQADDIDRLLRYNYHYPAISKDTGDDLRRLYLYHEKGLSELLDAEHVRQVKRLEKLAQEIAEEDSESVRAVIKERIDELRQRIRNMERDAPPSAQLELFDRDEYLQYQEDQRWLRSKLEQLRERQKTEPEQVRQSYQLRDVRIFPMALLYLLPERLVKEN